ncbi:MAG: 50S ribosomal protein L4 [Bacteroidia bacterium]
MKLSVFDIKGKETSKKVELSKDIFGAEPNDHAIYLDVKQYLANQRQGTHKSKERGEVAFSTKKLHKQKGTGGSRKGSKKNPLYKGGGRVFGPKPHDYVLKVNQKVKQLARISALSHKAKDNSIAIVEDFNLDTPKTKAYAEILSNLKITGKKTLLVLAENNKNIYLSSRNLGGAKVVNASDLNTYDILNANNLLLVESSLKQIETILSK